MKKSAIRRWGAALGAAAIIGIAAAGHGAGPKRAPRAEENTPAAQDAAEGGGRVQSGCQVIQTMGFSRCGHSVSRRVSAPEGLIGGDFGTVQAYYDQWRIESFAPEQIEMSREIPLFCPMHQVLSVNEAGEIVLTCNVYGDGMAVRKVYEGASIGDFSPEDQEKLVAGLGFDGVDEAENWLAVH